MCLGTIISFIFGKALNGGIWKRVKRKKLQNLLIGTMVLGPPLRLFKKNEASGEEKEVEVEEERNKKKREASKKRTKSKTEPLKKNNES